MKTSRLIKASLTFLLFIISIITINAQTETPKELTKKEKKALKKAEEAKQDSIDALSFSIVIDSKNWVLEANQLTSKSGQTVNVSSNLNFIAIETDEAFVQIGNLMTYGYNGVGGVSVKGDIKKYSCKKSSKNGSYFIMISVSSPLGSFDISINANSTGDMVRATVQGTTTGGEINYSGKIVPVSQSSVYKGRTLL